jgi:hypothetical protein
VLYWIVTRPDRDRATALTIFWLGDPAFFLGVGCERSRVRHFAVSNFDLLTEICQPWQRGAYIRAEL